MSLSPSESKLHISVDGWAVILALVAALLVRAGVIRVVSW